MRSAAALEKLSRRVEIGYVRHVHKLTTAGKLQWTRIGSDRFRTQAADEHWLTVELTDAYKLTVSSDPDAEKAIVPIVDWANPANRFPVHDLWEAVRVHVRIKEAADYLKLIADLDAGLEQ